MTELNIKIGGAAGQGLQRAGHILAKMFVRGGYHVFAIQDSMSRIRGGHNFFKLRIKETSVAAMTDRVDLVVALDEASVSQHHAELNGSGLLVLDSTALKIAADAPNMLDLPMKQLAMTHGQKAFYANSAAMGFIAGLVAFGLDHLKVLLAEEFPKGDPALKNLAVAEAGYALATDAVRDRFRIALPPKAGTRRMLLNGNEAVSLGAIAADCRFMSAYPMSPSTGIITFLASNEDRVERSWGQ